MGDSLGCNNKQKHGKWVIMQNYLHDEETRSEGSERRPSVFIFRLNIVLCDSQQAGEIVMEIEELKQKVPSDSVKGFSRVLLSVLEASILSSRN